MVYMCKGGSCLCACPCLVLHMLNHMKPLRPAHDRPRQRVDRAPCLVLLSPPPSHAQNVTLGGTGKEIGDRHPKLADNVLVGASATILGNIEIGYGAQIAAGSLVLKPVAPHTMVAGSPAKPVGKVRAAGRRCALC